MKFKRRHHEVAKKIHAYFLDHAPSVRFIEWDDMTDIQRIWWLQCAVTALGISDHEKLVRKLGKESKTEKKDAA